MSKTALVVSAHSADFVWRCGGAIALHAEKGFKVTVVCLSYGERGESAKLWRVPGMTLDRVKASREVEAKKAVPFCSPPITCVSTIRTSRPAASLIQRARRRFIRMLSVRAACGPSSTA